MIGEALAMVRKAGGDRVQVLDEENLEGDPSTSTQSCASSTTSGRLRGHPIGKGGQLPTRHSWFTAPLYRSFLDPDGRPLDMRLRRTY